MDRDRHVTGHPIATDPVPDHGRSIWQVDQRRINDRSTFEARTVDWTPVVRPVAAGVLALEIGGQSRFHPSSNA